jgi:hypothetical protein
MKKCKVCDGGGGFTTTKDGKWYECAICKGTGIAKPEPIPNIGLRTPDDSQCPTCKKLKEELEKLQDARGCLKAGEGRGDCEHFLPEYLEKTTDVYGRPMGWCQRCWDEYKMRGLYKEIARLKEDLKEEKMACNAYIKDCEDLREQLAKADVQVMTGSGHTGECKEGCQCDLAKMREVHNKDRCHPEPSPEPKCPLCGEITAEHQMGHYCNVKYKPSPVGGDAVADNT